MTAAAAKDKVIRLHHFSIKVNFLKVFWWLILILFLCLNQFECSTCEWNDSFWFCRTWWKMMVRWRLWKIRDFGLSMTVKLAVVAPLLSNCWKKNCKADNPFFSICNNRFLHGSQISNVENENLAAAPPFFAHFWHCLLWWYFKALPIG